jgi:2'-5' RNA ligase
VGAGGETARVFAALVLDPDLAADLDRRVTRALEGRVRFRRPRPEGLHLTLHFLGDVPAARVAALGEALGALEGLPAPRLSLAGTGAFPGWRRPRVLWVGAAEAPGTEGRLEALATAAARALGAPPGESFRAHVTVARPRDPGAGVPAAFEQLALDEPWRPRSVELLESLRGDGPSRYVSRTSVPLAP